MCLLPLQAEELRLLGGLSAPDSGSPAEPPASLAKHSLRWANDGDPSGGGAPPVQGVPLRRVLERVLRSGATQVRRN
eukprot:COSAG01_NODE_1452_length_10260_cov_26.827970_4_plen_77_part_00